MPEYIDRTAAITSPLWATDLCPAAVLSRLPSADVVPVIHAKWLESVSFESGFWVCSNCSFVSEAVAAYKLYNYCPNCGAKMDLEEE